MKKAALLASHLLKVHMPGLLPEQLVSRVEPAGSGRSLMVVSRCSYIAARNGIRGTRHFLFLLEAFFKRGWLTGQEGERFTGKMQRPGDEDGTSFAPRFLPSRSE
jgi:hypothetical protein